MENKVGGKSRLLLESVSMYSGYIDNNKKALLEKFCKVVDQFNISPEKKHLIKVLLNNQAAYNEYLKNVLLRESVTTSSAIAPLETYIFPILIRAMVRTFADQLVSVQPIQSTLAMVRILKTRYGTSKGKISEGDYGLQTFGSKGIKFSPYYTSPYVVGESDSRTVGTGSNNIATYTLAYPAVGRVTMVWSAAGNNNVTTILEKGQTIKLFGTDDNPFTVHLSFDNVITFTNNTGSNVTINFSLTYTTNLEANRSPSLDIALEKIEISAEVRRIFSAATIESILELAAHGIDWKETIGELLAAELAVELDRTIIQDIISKTIAEGYVSTFSADLPATWDRPVGEYIKNLYYAIMQANAEIFHRTRRIPGNWIVTSAKVAAALEAANYLVISENYLDEYSGMGFFPLGVLRGLRNKIFVDVSRSFPENVILIGAKGNSPYEAGYIYAPYAPAIPILSNIMDMEVPAGTIYMGLYQAAGFRMIDNGFYHIIQITGDISNLYATYGS